MQSNCERITNYIYSIKAISSDFDEYVRRRNPKEAVDQKEKIVNILQEIKGVEEFSWLLGPIEFIDPPDDLIALWFKNTFKNKMPGAVFIPLDGTGFNKIEHRLLPRFPNRPVLIYSDFKQDWNYNPVYKKLIKRPNVGFFYGFSNVIVNSEEILNLYREIRKRIMTSRNEK